MTQAVQFHDTGAGRLAYSRAGVGSDRVASTLMSENYSDQFNSPIGNQ